MSSVNGYNWRIFHSNGSPAYEIALKQALFLQAKEGKIGPTILVSSHLGYPPYVTIGRNERADKLNNSSIAEHGLTVLRRFDAGYGILKGEGDILVDLLTPRKALPPYLQGVGIDPLLSHFAFYEFAIRPSRLVLRQLGLPTMRIREDLLVPTDDKTLKLGSGTLHIGNVTEGCLQIFAQEPSYNGHRFLKLVEQLFRLEPHERQELERTTFVERHIPNFRIDYLVQKILDVYAKKFDAVSGVLPEDVKEEAEKLSALITDETYVFNQGKDHGKLCYTDIG